MIRGQSVGALDVTPSASRLTNSLRDIGYDFVAAVSDLVDNSVSAGAWRVDIEIVFDGERSHVVIADDGSGMSESELHEALRFGTRRSYERSDLGRYGLGLKTASISQCRRVTVVTRRAPTYRRVSAKTLDVDHIARCDRWEIIDPPDDTALTRAEAWLSERPGTVVLWDDLDRVLPERHPEGGWARRRLEQLSLKTMDYLGMVFHRFIEGEVPGRYPLTITVNGEKVRPWNPFAPDEESRIAFPVQLFEVYVGAVHGFVELRRFVLPPRKDFSSQAEFDRLAGPLKWNRQQGLYIYRGDRLIQSGGWCGIRAADEHTKFARAAVEFDTSLDDLFQINVAKMKVALPAEVRAQLERPLLDLCHHADAVYRRDGASGREPKQPQRSTAAPGGGDWVSVGSALLSAALEAGEYEAFARIISKLRVTCPEVAASLDC